MLIADARTPQGFIANTAGRNRRELAGVDGPTLAKFHLTEDPRVPWDDVDDPER